MSVLYLVVGLVAVERIALLMYGVRNTRRLMAEGGVEFGRQHYPLLIALQTAWLFTLAADLPAGRPVNLPMLGLFVFLQLIRLWAVCSLGAYWTMRVITLPDRPLVRRGPYRLVRHPEYIVMVLETTLLPLMFGAASYAAVFTVLTVAVLAWRVLVENRALRSRPRLSGDVGGRAALL